MADGLRWPVVLFDLDGTIIEPFDGIARAVREAYAAVGEPAPPDAVIRTWIGPPIGESLHRSLGHLGPEAVQTALAAFRRDYDARGALSATAHPGMRELLGALRGHAAFVAVVTMKPRHPANLILDHLALRGLVDGLYAPESHDAGASKAALVEAALAAAARPGPGVVVGDRPEDVLAARANGLDAVGVGWGFGAADELVAAGAEAVVADAGELTALLGAGRDDG